MVSTKRMLPIALAITSEEVQLETLDALKPVIEAELKRLAGKPAVNARAN